MPLFLLPNLLGQGTDPKEVLPATLSSVVASLDGLIAESERGGRSFLKKFPTKKKPHCIPIALLNEHTPLDHLDFLLEPAQAGENWGVVSDAGLPCLADPGSLLVRRARGLGIPVEAYSGPSSITQALLLSGLSGQRFSFRGYIAKQPLKRSAELKKWEREARQEGSTQIFIEAPYRNLHTLKTCLESLQRETFFCIATDLTLSTEWIRTLPISAWKKQPCPLIHKRPTIFLFQVEGVEKKE